MVQSMTSSGGKTGFRAQRSHSGRPEEAPGRDANACLPSCSPPSEASHNRGLDDRRPLTGRAADEELAALAKAVGHPARVRILRLLVKQKGCVCGDIVDEVGLAQSTVSQHLKVMKSAGLIQGDVDGPRVCYCIHEPTLQRLKALITGI